MSSTTTFRRTSAAGLGTLLAATTIAVIAATASPAAAAPPLDAVDDIATPLGVDGSVSLSLLANDIGQDGESANCVGLAANCSLDPAALSLAGVNGLLEIDPNSGEAVYITTIDPAVDPAGYSAISAGTPCAGVIDTFAYTLIGAVAGVPVPDSTDTASVTVAAGTAVRVPDAQPDTASTQAGVPVTGNALVNDCDQTNATPPSPDNVSVSITAQPEGGTVEIGPDGTYTYTPNADFSGTDSFAYTLTTIDAGEVRTASTTVTIEVAPAPDPNQAPTAYPGLLLVRAGTTGTVSVYATDPDGDPLTYTVSRQPRLGSVTGGEAGVFAYTAPPSRKFLRLDTFQVTVCDPEGACDTTAVFVLIYR